MGTAQVFFTADWHLGEDRFKIMQRPFSDPQEAVDHMVECHNSMVTPEDTVHVVGDAVYKGAREFLPQVARFNGRKTLYRGNHDAVFSDDELAPYFERIVPEGEVVRMHVDGVDVAVQHYPTRGVSNAFNLVGHIHALWKVQKNALNVGVDAHHFYPVPEDIISFYLTAITDYYDEDVWAHDHASNTAHALRGKSGTYLK